MATINLVLDKRRALKDGTYPLVFRLRIEKKFIDIATGFKIMDKSFNSKTKPINKKRIFFLFHKTNVV
jgi:hypothetical protein